MLESEEPRDPTADEEPQPRFLKELRENPAKVARNWLRVDPTRNVVVYTEPRWLAVQSYTAVSDSKADVYAAIEAWRAFSAECRAAVRDRKGWSELQLAEIAVHLFQQEKVVTQPPDAETLPSTACGSVVTPDPDAAAIVEDRVVRAVADIRLQTGWDESQPTRVIEEAMRLIARECRKSTWGVQV